MRSRGIAVATAFLAACGGHQPPDLLLRGVHVIDGSGAGPSPPVQVEIKDGRVVGIGPESGQPRHALEVIDLTGHYLLPGFVDLHVHLPPDSAIQEAVLEQLLRYGVTTILNPGARRGSGVRLRDRLDDAMPRMLTAGLIIEGPNDGSDVSDWAVVVANEEEARQEVRRQAAAGVDFVKTYSSLSPELVSAVVEEASTAGLPVIAHAGATTWGQAVDAGVAMLVHSGWGTPMDEIIDLANPDSATDAEWYAAYADAPSRTALRRLADKLQTRGVAVVPTLAITKAAGLGRTASLLPDYETHLAPEADLPDWWSAGWRERHPQYGDVDEGEDELLRDVYWPGVLGITRALHEAGVLVAVGTDVGNAWITPGTSFHYEMSLYAEAGLAPLEILTMATRNGALALGLDGSLGSVAVGKQADLVVLRSDPTQDIRATRDIELVIRGGLIVDRRE